MRAGLKEVFTSLSGELAGVWSTGLRVKRESFGLPYTITPTLLCLFVIGTLIKNTWLSVLPLNTQSYTHFLRTCVSVHCCVRVCLRAQKRVSTHVGLSRYLCLSENSCNCNISVEICRSIMTFCGQILLYNSCLTLWMTTDSGQTFCFGRPPINV